MDDNLLSNRTGMDLDRDHSSGQGLTDYGLPPNPSRKSFYMAELLRRNMSLTGNPNSSSKKTPNKSRGPLVERMSFLGTDEKGNEVSPQLASSGTVRNSFGGLKIFQKVSDDIAQKKNIASLRTSFVNSGSKNDIALESLIEMLASASPGISIPELPNGKSLVITIFSNWGDPLE